MGGFDSILQAMKEKISSLASEVAEASFNGSFGNCFRGRNN